MPKCHFCQHDNPADAQRCENCGAWVTQEIAPESQQTADREEREPSPGGDVPRPDPESVEGQILALMEGGKKIPAIKLYRQAKAVGLVEAKEAVEELAARYGIQSQAAGCGTAVLMLCVGWVLLRGLVW